MNEEKILKLGPYCRTSTIKQKNEETIDQQVDGIKAYAKAFEGKFNLSKFYIDDGYSGFLPREERPAFDNLLKDIEEGLLDGIISRDLGRLSRKTAILLDLSDFLRNNNKELILIKQQIDTTTPTGRAFYSILSTFVQWEAESIKERLQDARIYAKEVKNVKMGRPEKPIPDKLKDKIIFWYGNQKNGVKRISQLVLSEDIQDYPKWFREKYPSGFGKKSKKKFYISPETIRKRLLEWNIELRKMPTKLEQY